MSENNAVDSKRTFCLVNDFVEMDNESGSVLPYAEAVVIVEAVNLPRNKELGDMIESMLDIYYPKLNCSWIED
jgi:hypothetical protein